MVVTEMKDTRGGVTMVTTKSPTMNLASLLLLLLSSLLTGQVGTCLSVVGHGRVVGTLEDDTHLYPPLAHTTNTDRGGGGGYSRSSSSSSYPYQYPPSSTSSRDGSYQPSSSRGVGYQSSSSSRGDIYQPTSSRGGSYQPSSSSSSMGGSYQSSSSSRGGVGVSYQLPGSSRGTSYQTPGSSRGGDTYRSSSSSSRGGNLYQPSSSSTSSRGRYDSGDGGGTKGGGGGGGGDRDDDRNLVLHGVEVPVYKFRGEDARLECKFDRRSDPLYSVKWYKDDHEFYRYLSRRKKPKQTFPIDGVQVDLQWSNAEKVQLKNLTFNSSGMYKCEVSGDSPFFRTYEKQKLMMVVELPEKGPTIEGGKSHYRVGETARLNCTSSKSKPAAQLTWYINNEAVPQQYLVEYYPWVHRDGLESRRLGLMFTVNQSHFRKGSLELRCKATVATVYSASKEEDATIYSEQPVILQQREDLIHVRNAVCAVLPTFLVTVAAAMAVLAALQVGGGREVT